MLREVYRALPAAGAATNHGSRSAVVRPALASRQTARPRPTPQIVISLQDRVGRRPRSGNPRQRPRRPGPVFPRWFRHGVGGAPAAQYPFSMRFPRRLIVWMTLLAVLFYTVSPTCASFMPGRGMAPRSSRGGAPTCACLTCPHAPGSCCCDPVTPRSTCSMGRCGCHRSAGASRGLWTSGNPLAVFPGRASVAPPRASVQPRGSLTRVPGRLASNIPTPPPQAHDQA